MSADPKPVIGVKYGPVVSIAGIEDWIEQVRAERDALFAEIAKAKPQ